MKITGGVLAVLLLATTVAVGRQHASYSEPFPQSANPALASGTAEVPGNANVASSMAVNQNGTSEVTLSAFSDRHDKAGLGSPFPSAANPSLGRTGEEMSPDNNIDLGSPFPSAANPSGNR